MTRQRFRWVVVLGVALLAVMAEPPASAQESLTAQVAVVLILDNSGSMQENDPSGLRFAAIQMFVALLDPGDAAAVILFSTQSQPLTDGLAAIGDPAGKGQLLRQLGPRPADGWTDMRAALIAARLMLEQTDLAGRETVVVLLTDGQAEVAGQTAEYEEEVVVAARDLGVRMLCVALTPNAQTPVLSRIAELTRGVVVPAETASDLLDAFLEVFSRLKDRAVIGSSTVLSPGWAGLPLEPALAPYIEGATFVVSKPPGVSARLLAPDGHTVQTGTPGVAFVYSDDPRFAVISVEHPAGGPWGFELAGEGAVQARAVLRSRLRLDVAEPVRFHEVGQPMTIVLRLFEEQADGRTVKVIGEAAFSARITRPDGRQESLDLFYDDGTHGDLGAGDGDYTRLYVNTDDAGNYDIAVRGWKGSVPVARSICVELVSFPEIVVDEPAGSRYEIRGRPQPLQVRLEGATPAILDQGDVLARIRVPSGDIREVVLQRDGSTYTGTFQLTEAGQHEVLFLAVGATYRGLPYTHSAQVLFEVYSVPMLAIASAPLDLGRVETGVARRGLTLTLPVSSTSRQTELVQARLEGMPGITLRLSHPLAVPPGQAKLVLPLAASPTVEPGSLQGRLLFDARQGLDVVGAEVPLRLELFQPMLRAMPTAGVLDAQRGCFGPGEGFALVLTLFSEQPERIDLLVESDLDLILSPTTVTALAPLTQVTLHMAAREDPPPGEYEARLIVQGRPGLEIIGGDVIPLHLRVEPFSVRCRGQLLGGGMGLIVVVGGLILAVRRIRAASRPLLVTGSLQHWPVGCQQAVVEVDLTALRRAKVYLGRDEACHVPIPDPAMADQHAYLRAGKVGQHVRVTLVPLDEVRTGYRQVTGPMLLEHGCTFRAGTRTFRFLSDEGG